MTQTITISTTISRPPVTNDPAAVNVARCGFETMFRDDMQNVFFNTADFAETATIYHATAKPPKWSSYSVIFDDPSVKVRTESDAEIIDVKPFFIVAEFALEYPVSKSDRIVLRGKTYAVECAESDGVGMLTVTLKK